MIALHSLESIGKLRFVVRSPERKGYTEQITPVLFRGYNFRSHKERPMIKLTKLILLNCVSRVPPKNRSDAPVFKSFNGQPFGKNFPLRSAPTARAPAFCLPAQLLPCPLPEQGLLLRQKCPLV